MIKNTNGKQDSARNIQSFREWRKSQTDDDLQRLVHRGQLKRADIIAACGFGRSALTQNPAIKLFAETVALSLEPWSN